MAKEKYALVSTVDTIPGFPSHCVFVFDTEMEAVKHAVDLICKFDKTVAYNGHVKTWTINETVCTSPEDLLHSWQEGLESVEWLHVMPVRQLQVRRPRKKD